MAATRILYVAGELTAGGYQRQLALLLAGLDRERIEPHLAVWRFAEDQPRVRDFRAIGVPIHDVDWRRGRVRRMAALCGIARAVRPRYVHSYCSYMNFPAWVAARACEAHGALGSFRSAFFNELMENGPVVGRLCAAMPRLAVTNSEAAAATARAARAPFRPGRVWTVPNAVDTGAFRPADSAGDGPPRDPSGPVRLLGVGRLVVQKRWGWLLSILSELAGNPALPAWTLTLCGEGDERAAIARACDQLGLAARVELVGHQADILGWFRRSDVLVLPSVWEGTPNVVAEALACGVPVLATDVGDVRQLVRDGADGFVVGVDDTQAFGDRLRELIAAPALRRRMGVSGRAWMVETRSPQRMVDETLRVYREAGWKIG